MAAQVQVDFASTDTTCSQPMIGGNVEPSAACTPVTTCTQSGNGNYYLKYCGEEWDKVTGIAEGLAFFDKYSEQQSVKDFVDDNDDAMGTARWFGQKTCDDFSVVGELKFGTPDSSWNGVADCEAVLNDLKPGSNAVCDGTCVDTSSQYFDAAVIGFENAELDNILKEDGYTTGTASALTVSCLVTGVSLFSLAI